MGLFDNCPNCDSETWDGGFCGWCKPKKEEIFRETGKVCDRFNTQYKSLDNELLRINIGKIWKQADEEERRRLSFFKL